MKYGEGVLYNFVFPEFSFKTVSGDVTAFHRIFCATAPFQIIICQILFGFHASDLRKSSISMQLTCREEVQYLFIYILFLIYNGVIKHIQNIFKVANADTHCVRKCLP